MTNKKGKKGVNAGSFVVVDFLIPTADVVEVKNHTKVLVWGLRSYGKAQDRKSYFQGLGGVSELLETLTKKRFKTVFIADLSFNGAFITDALKDMKFTELENSQDMTENSFNMFVGGITNIAYVLTIRMKDISGKPNFITFKCAKNVLAGESVEDIANRLQITQKPAKMEGIWDIETISSDMQESLEFTTKTMGDAISKISDNYTIKLTTPATAMNDFRTHFNSIFSGGYVEINNHKQPADAFTFAFGGRIDGWRDKYSVLDWDQYGMIKRSYVGAYTCFNDIHKGKELNTPKGSAYDANSLYPSVAMVNVFPYGKGYKKPNKDWKFTCEFVTIMPTFITIKKQFKGKVPPLIRYNKEWVDSFIEDEDNYGQLFTFTREEWEFIKKYYDWAGTEVENLFFKGVYIFKSWFEEKKHLKEQASQEGRDFDAYFHKLIYNSLIGKFGQQDYETNTEIDTDGDTFEVENGQFHMGVASYVLSYARIELWKVIIANFDKWIYSDTDSIWLTEGPLKGAKMSSTEFGAWKIEKNFTKFKGLKKKVYMYQDKATTSHILVLAGASISKTTTTLQFDQFNEGIEFEDAAIIKTRIKGGYFKKVKPYKIKGEK